MNGTASNSDARKRHAQPEVTPKAWPENVWPTPEELADWLVICTPAERILHAAAALESGQVAARCFELNHEHRLSRLGEQQP